MSGLAELVEELALGRVTFEGDTRSFTEPLLHQLKAAVFGNIGASGKGRSSGTPIPIDATAFTLWEDITGQIAAQFEGATDLPSRFNTPMSNLLAWWAAFSAAIYRTDVLHTDEAPLLAREVASERLERWAQRIRDHFAAPRVHEVMVACPNCGLERVVIGDGELAEEVFALAAVVRSGAVTVMCRNPRCLDVFGEHSEWSGDHQLAELGRRTGHAIMPAELRAALEPVEAAEWTAETGKTVEPFDPTNPEHAALLKPDTPASTDA
jgi:hypothetical protein